MTPTMQQEQANLTNRLGSLREWAAPVLARYPYNKAKLARARAFLLNPALTAALSGPVQVSAETFSTLLGYGLSQAAGGLVAVKVFSDTGNDSRASTIQRKVSDTLANLERIVSSFAYTQEAVTRGLVTSQNISEAWRAVVQSGRHRLGLEGVRGGTQGSARGGVRGSALGIQNSASNGARGGLGIVPLVAGVPIVVGGVTVAPVLIIPVALGLLVGIGFLIYTMTSADSLTPDIEAVGPLCAVARCSPDDVRQILETLARARAENTIGSKAGNLVFYGGMLVAVVALGYGVFRLESGRRPSQAFNGITTIRTNLTNNSTARNWNGARAQDVVDGAPRGSIRHNGGKTVVVTCDESDEAEMRAALEASNSVASVG